MTKILHLKKKIQLKGTILSSSSYYHHHYYHYHCYSKDIAVVTDSMWEAFRHCSNRQQYEIPG